MTTYSRFQQGMIRVLGTALLERVQRIMTPLPSPVTPGPDEHAE